VIFTGTVNMAQTVKMVHWWLGSLADEPVKVCYNVGMTTTTCTVTTAPGVKCGEPAAITFGEFGECAAHAILITPAAATKPLKGGKLVATEYHGVETHVCC
jgi:hypothetical protein